MDDEQAAPLWEWQGWFGLADDVAREKPIVEAMDLHSVGAVRPERGAPPMHVTSDGVMTMFAFHVPVGQRLPTPPGLFEAEPSIVGRLVGA
jgi:hypothetical protein